MSSESNVHSHINNLVNFFNMNPLEFMTKFNDKFMPIYKFRYDDYHIFRSHVLRAQRINVRELLTNPLIPTHTESYKIRMNEYNELLNESDMNEYDLKRVSSLDYPMLSEEYIREHMRNDHLGICDLTDRWITYHRYMGQIKPHVIAGSCCVDYFTVLSLKDMFGLYMQIYGNDNDNIIQPHEFEQFVLHRSRDESMKLLSHIRKDGIGNYVVLIGFDESNHEFKYIRLTY